MMAKTTTRTTRGARDALDLLKADHAEVKKMFRQFEKFKKQDDQKGMQQVAQAACAALSVHAQIEEEIFYPALREVLEETGLRCTLGEPLGSTTYAPGGIDKEVRWFRMEPTDDSGTPDGEVDELRWLTPAEALELLSYESERELLTRL
jgi:hypothetical protein